MKIIEYIKNEIKILEEELEQEKLELKEAEDDGCYEKVWIEMLDGFVHSTKSKIELLNKIIKENS